MKLLYIHDLNKAANAELLADLQQNYTVVAPELSQEQMTSPDYLDAYIRNMLGEDFILVGEGLGAYWANYFADKHIMLALCIAPCTNPKAELDLDLTPFSEFSCRKGYVLLDEQQSAIDWATIEEIFNPYDYLVLPYNKTERPIAPVAKECLEDLAYSHRTRAHGLSNFLGHKDSGHVGWRVAGKVISNILFTQDPMNTSCVANNDYAMYDTIASQIADDYVISEMSLEFSLARRFKFHFGAAPSDVVIQQLAAQIQDSLPDVVKKPVFPFKQEQRDLSSEFTTDQVKVLSELNDKLTAFEKKVFPQAINIDVEYQHRLNDANDPLSQYDLALNISVYLQEDDEAYNDDIDNFMTIICELKTGCSNEPEAFLQRLNINHNDLPADHPLSAFKHSWLFHQLYAVSNISFADLLRIGFVWIDIDVDYRRSFDC